MKTSTPTDKHASVYNTRLSYDYLIIMQLYRIAKTTSKKQVPTLRKGDEKKY